MKKLIIVLAMVLSMTAGVFGQAYNVIGRTFAGDILPMMLGFGAFMTADSGGMADVLAITKQLSNVQVLNIWGGSGLSVIIKDKDVYVGSFDKFKFDGRDASKLSLGKLGTDSMDVYVIHIKDFQVGKRITVPSDNGNKVYIIQDVDIRRMKKAVLKRNVSVDVFSLEGKMKTYMKMYGKNWEEYFYKQFPETDLGE